jgi:hypothetical protein
VRIVSVLEAPSEYVYAAITDYLHAYRINPSIVKSMRDETRATSKRIEGISQPRVDRDIEQDPEFVAKHAGKHGNCSSRLRRSSNPPIENSGSSPLSVIHKKKGTRPLFLWMAEREGLLGPAARPRSQRCIPRSRRYRIEPSVAIELQSRFSSPSLALT